MMNVEKGNKFLFQYNVHLGKQQSNKSSHHDNDSTLQTNLGPTYSSTSDKTIKKVKQPLGLEILSTELMWI